MGDENERYFTPNQTKFLMEYAVTFQKAQDELNKFLNYLSNEYNVPKTEKWIISADFTKFVKQEEIKTDDKAADN